MLKARIHITRRDGSIDILHFPFQPSHSTIEDLIEFVEEIHRDKMSVDSSLEPSNFQLDYSKVCFDTKFPDQLVEGTKLQMSGSTKQDLVIHEVKEQSDRYSLKDAQVLELPLQPYHAQSFFFMKEVEQTESVKLNLPFHDYIDIDNPSLLNTHIPFKEILANLGTSASGIPFKEILANMETSAWNCSNCNLIDSVHLDVDLPLKRMNLSGQCIDMYLQEKFVVYIKNLAGKTISLSCDSSTTVLDLKKGIEKVDLVPCNEQRLIFSGKQLEEDKVLSDYGIGEESTIHLVLRLRGGMYHPTSGRSDLCNENKLRIEFILPNGKQRSCFISAGCDEETVKEIAMMHLTDQPSQEKINYILKKYNKKERSLLITQAPVPFLDHQVL